MNKLFLIALIVLTPFLFFVQASNPFGGTKAVTTDSVPSIAIIELFSSEDCSSCPSADALFNRIAINAATNHQPIYVLEEHVDYLNNFGWKDPFSAKQFEDRQLAYQHFFNREGSFTPQILVNGTHEIYSANLLMANDVIQEALKEPVRVTISFSASPWNDSTAEMDYHLSSTDKNWIINFALVQKNAVSHVTSGENSGRTLTHVNVVRQLASAPITIPDGIVELNNLPRYAPNTYSVIAFVQDKLTMKIIGAVQTDI